MQAKPHVSPALQHTRSWVSLCALLVVVAAAGQMLVYGVMHFTSVRYTSDEPRRPASSALVVSAGAPTGKPDSKSTASRTPAGQPAKPAAKDPSAPPTLDEVRARPLSDADGFMRGLTAVTTSAGILSSIILAWMTALGGIIAAGAAVPGIDKTIRAAACSVILAIIALPLGQLLGSDVFPGVFSTYSAMAQGSESVQAGLLAEGALVGQFVALPMLAIGMAAVVGMWYRGGVEAGIIVTSANDLDDKLEAELQSVRSRGGSVGRGTVRAVGALNQAIGASPLPSTAGMTSERTMAASARRAAEEADEDVERMLGKRPRGMRETDPGAPLKRLI